MRAFVARRIAAMIVILLALTASVYLLQRISHTDPVHAYLGPNASAQAIAHERRVLGYDRPLVDQYGHYVWNALQGNLGVSLRTRRPVATDIAAYLPATAELTIAALALALLLGALLGVGAAGHWRGAGAFRLLMLSGASTPSFLLALVLILVLNGKLHLLPATGDIGGSGAPSGPTGMVVVDTLLHGRIGAFFDALRHLVLPAVCVAIGPAVSIGRVLRGSLETTYGADFVRTARSKGLPERVVLFRHALRNSLSAALSMTGLQVGLMFAGVVVVETIFAWPGIGLYTDQSIPSADFPAIAGVTLVLGAGYVVINALVDLVQALVDPRVALR